MTGLHSLWIVISLLLFVDSGHAHQARKLLPIPDKLVVLTFDDGNKSDITHVAPLLKEYGFRATFVVTEGLGFLKDNGHYLTWEDIRQLSEDGFEIGNHTGSHPNLEKLSKQQILSEIEHIEQRCREHAIPVPRTFVYPGYHHSLQAVEVLTNQGYQFARRGVSPEYPDAHNGARGPVYDPAQDHPLLIPTTGYSGPDWDFEDLAWAVEQATDGKIAVLNFHGVPALDHPWVNTEPDDFASYMKYLHDQGCTVIALGDLAKYVDPAKRPEDPYAPIRRRGLITPVDLKCEYMTNPVGIDPIQPRLTWVLQSTQRAQTQTAYQVLVASSQEKLRSGLADRWDSGKVDSDQSIHVAYQGNVLRSGEKCWWKVRAWGKDGRPGPFSTAASFQMGLLDKTEWQGKWIGAEKDVSAPLLRKAFSLEKEIKGATIHVSGLGYYELYLNGDKVGDHVLDPGTTYYHNDQPFRLDPRVLYVTYDVTKHLRRGPNAVGVMLGHGWYSKEADIPPSPSFRDSYGDRPRLILQLNLEFLDGQKANLVTDGSWKVSQGPILYNDFCNGEELMSRGV